MVGGGAGEGNPSGLVAGFKAAEYTAIAPPAQPRLSFVKKRLTRGGALW